MNKYNKLLTYIDDFADNLKKEIKDLKEKAIAFIKQINKEEISINNYCSICGELANDNLQYCDNCYKEYKKLYLDE